MGEGVGLTVEAGQTVWAWFPMILTAVLVTISQFLKNLTLVIPSGLPSAGPGGDLLDDLINFTNN